MEVVTRAGRVPLSRRIRFQQKHDGTWSLPSGAIEPGENSDQAVVRGVREESGLDVSRKGLSGPFPPITNH